MKEQPQIHWLLVVVIMLLVFKVEWINRDLIDLKHKILTLEKR